MHYMQWIKTDAPARVELRPSGIPGVRTDELRFEPGDVNIQTTGVYGDSELAAQLAAYNGVEPERLLIVPGASSGIFIAMATACARARRRILIESFVYEPILRAAQTLGLHIERVPRLPELGFDLNWDRLTSMLNNECDALFLTNLHNPSGHYLDPERLGEVAELCRARHVTLIVDEVYLPSTHLVLGRPRWSAANLGSHVITINSLTKLHGFSGLRIGWMCGSRALIDSAKLVMDVLSVNNAGPCMSLGKAAMADRVRWEERYVERQRINREALDAWLRGEPRVSAEADNGQLYACLRLNGTASTSGASSGVLPADEFARRLRARYDTAVVPGTFFELDRYVRIGLGMATETLREGLRNISSCLDDYETNDGNAGDQATGGTVSES